MDDFGPATAQINDLLGRCETLTPGETQALRRAANQTWGRGPSLHRWTARDHAWARLHEAVRAYDLDVQFQAVWLAVARHPGVDQLLSLGVADAACALMCRPWCRPAGPFRAVDADTLLAVWRSVVDRDADSALALHLMTSCPCTPEELWKVIAAVSLPTPDR